VALFLLQTADPLFPTGAYAHSFGLEEMVRLGRVRCETSLRDYLLRHVIPAQTEQELPYLRFAFHAAMDGDISELCAIDREISAWKLARETRLASAQLGARRLASLVAIVDDPLLQELASRVEAGSASGHHLVVCGLQAVVGGMPLDAALAASFYQSLAATVGAAMKLIRIGQESCQRVLWAGCRHAEVAIEESLQIPRNAAGCFNPLLEIASMRHERAGERLFIS
jgi:urease accessory protein